MKMKHQRDHTRKEKKENRDNLKSKLEEFTPDKLFQLALKSISQTGCEVCGSFNIRHHTEYEWFCVDCSSITLPSVILKQLNIKTINRRIT